LAAVSREMAAVDNVNLRLEHCCQDIVAPSNCLRDYFWCVWMAAIVPTVSPQWECVRVSER